MNDELKIELYDEEIKNCVVIDEDDKTGLTCDLMCMYLDENEYICNLFGEALFHKKNVSDVTLRCDKCLKYFS